MSVGDFLRTLGKKRGLTQKSIAQQLGITTPALNRCLSDTMKVPIDRVDDFIAAYDMDEKEKGQFLELIQAQPRGWFGKKSLLTLQMLLELPKADRQRVIETAKMWDSLDEGVANDK